MAAATEDYCLVGCNAVYPGRSMPTFRRMFNLRLLGGWKQHVPRTRRQRSAARRHVLEDINRSFAVDFALKLKMQNPESEEKNLGSCRESNPKPSGPQAVIIIDAMAVRCVLVRLRSSGMLRHIAGY
jgi:hypothetical protein